MGISEKKGDGGFKRVKASSQHKQEPRISTPINIASPINCPQTPNYGPSKEVKIMISVQVVCPLCLMIHFSVARLPWRESIW